MAEFFGNLERLVADLYPYRWLIGIGVLIVLAGAAAFWYRSGWHTVLWRHRTPTTVIGAPLLALVIFVGYDIGSPLFTNKTVEEEFPFAFAAEIPDDMDMEDVEMVMSMLAKVDQAAVDETMPDDMPMMKPAAEDVSAQSSALVASEDDSEDEITEAAEEVAEQATGDSTADGVAVKIKTGSFRDQDSFHKGSGQADIYRGPDGSYLLRVEEFRVTNGPDLHVFLSPHPNPQSRDQVTAGHVDLGKLKGNIGNQNYPIPESTDIESLQSVVIYCVPFRVIFSVASLEDIG